MIPIHNLESQSSKPITIHSLGELTHYDFGEPHRHTYFEFFVFEKGGGTHMIDFAEFPITPGSIHIVAPGQVHMVKRELKSRGYVLLFESHIFESNHFVNNFLLDHICYSLEDFPPSYKFEEKEQKEIAVTMEQAWNNYRSDLPLKNELVMSLLTVMLIHCLRSRSYVQGEAVSRDQKIYAQFRRLLTINFKTIKKVKEYAAELAVTEKSLNEIVHARTGNSASAIIYQQLVLEARRLLKTGMLAKEVAFELNFDDPAHFSKFFKTQTGISPGEFQKIQY